MMRCRLWAAPAMDCSAAAGEARIENWKSAMIQDPSNIPATPLNASALVLTDGTIVSLASESRMRAGTLIGQAFGIIRRYWFRLLLGGLLGLAAGFGLMQVLSPSYTASVVIEPGQVSQSLENEGKLSALTSSLSAFDTLPQMTKDFLQLVQSNIVAARLMNDPSIMQRLFAEDWDPERKVWRQPEGWASRLRGWARVAMGRPAWEPPNIDRVNAALAAMVKIKAVGDGMIQEISIEMKNPESAAAILNAVVLAADETLREREAARLKASVDYWQNLLSRAASLENRNALINNIQDAEKRAVFANVDLPFSIDILDPVVTPVTPSGPRGLLVVLACVFLGIMLSLLTILLRRERSARATLRMDMMDMAGDAANRLAGPVGERPLPRRA
jgi:uncharacterized protein involved in exopolysaccharide biosynthesis